MTMFSNRFQPLIELGIFRHEGITPDSNMKNDESGLSIIKTNASVISTPNKTDTPAVSSDYQFRYQRNLFSYAYIIGALFVINVLTEYNHLLNPIFIVLDLTLLAIAIPHLFGYYLVLIDNNMCTNWPAVRFFKLDEISVIDNLRSDVMLWYNQQLCS
jgi:hypothetical protein